MINRDQITNLRKLFVENQNAETTKDHEGRTSAAGESGVPGQLRHLHEKIASETFSTQAPSEKIARSIAVTSGKGGVGKTNFVANLSIVLSKLGKKVLIIDADLGMANVDVIYGIRPRFNLFHVITGQKKISEITVTGPGGVLLVPGGSGIVELANINEGERRHFISAMRELESRIDIILVDTSAGINKNVMCFLKACSEIMVITVPEPPAMADAYGLIKAMVHSEKNPSHRFGLVVNRVVNVQEATDVYDRLSMVSRRFLNIPLENAGYIFDDRAVPTAVRAQKPFVTEQPFSRATQCVETIGQRLLDIQGQDGSFTAMSKIRSGISSFFSRLGELFD